MALHLSHYIDGSLLLLRAVVAIIFLSSGWIHATHPFERGKAIGMSPLFTLGLGIWELTGGISVLLGIFPRIGALMLIGVMFGAIYKKIFVWHQGFYYKSTGGWHYDLIFLVANLVILTTGGGKMVLLR